MSFFEKLKQGLSRTRDGIAGKVARLISSKTAIDDDFLEQLEEILLGADVGAGTTGDVVDAIRRRVRTEGYENPRDLQRLLRDEIRRQLEGETVHTPPDPFSFTTAPPHVVLVVGINGAGKTTTVGKLAYEYRQRGKNVVIAAADTFRAAANEQLEIWAKRAGATLIQQARGSDPAAVAFDALRSAMAHDADVVIIDTAGRLHTKVNLMEELKKIKRVLQKQSPAIPHEVLLVLDASTGQNGLQQAKQFGAAVGVTGLVLTKLDGTAKGGIVLAIARELNIPVKFIGVGEKLGDLQPFDPRMFVDAMFEQ